MTFLKNISKGWKFLIEGISLGGFALTGYTFCHDMGGDLSATINGQAIENNETKEVTIFMDNARANSNFSVLYPTFSNSSSYSIRDFSLNYHLSSTSMQFIPSEYYKMYDDGGCSYTLKYEETVLPGYKSVENPIKEIVASENGGSLTLRAEATYDGCSNPYVYTLKARYVIVPNKESLDFEQWKQKCHANYHEAYSGSTFYLSSNGHMEYADHINLLADNEESSTQPAKPVQQVKPATTQPAKPQPSPTTQPSSTSGHPSNATTKPHAYTRPQKTKQQKLSSVSITQKAQSDFLLGVNRYAADTPDTPDTIEYVISAQYPDSITVLCLREKNLNTDREENSILSLKGGANISRYRISKTTSKYISHAICTQNPEYADSVEVEKDKITNNTRHAIAMCSEDGEHTFLLRPYETETIHWMQPDTINFRYYDVPTNILTRQYAPLSPTPSREEALVMLIIGLIIGFSVLPFGWLILTAKNLFENDYTQIKKDWNDVKSLDSIKFILSWGVSIAALLVVLQYLGTILLYYGIKI